MDNPARASTGCRAPRQHPVWSTHAFAPQPGQCSPLPGLNIEDVRQQRQPGLPRKGTARRCRAACRRIFADELASGDAGHRERSPLATRSRVQSPHVSPAGGSQEALEFITVTMPLHPLCGQRLALIRTVGHRHGKRHVEIVHPRGWCIRVPESWTDRVAFVEPVLIGGQPVCILPDALLALAENLRSASRSPHDAMDAQHHSTKQPPRSTDANNDGGVVGIVATSETRCSGTPT
jgi:hypothetical protein